MYKNISNIIKQSTNLLSDITKNVSTVEKKKSSSFYDDYLERSSQKKHETESAIKNPTFKLPDLTLQKSQSAIQSPESVGSTIKKNIKNVLSKKYGALDTKNLFDDIDDKDVEDNIETAENTIKTNIDRGALNKSLLPKLPNLRDGLALSYAAANKGNNKEATKAREAAYTEDEPLVKATGMKLLSTEFPKIQTENEETIKAPSFAKFTQNIDEVPKIENPVWKQSNETKTETLFDNSKDKNKKGIKANSNTIIDNNEFEFNVDRKEKEKPQKIESTIYDGNIWGLEPPKDLFYSDLNEEQLASLDWVTWADLHDADVIHEATLRTLGNATSITNKKMNAVVNDMIDHFFDGTGTDYSNPDLTDEVEKHSETQRYMKDFTKVFDKQLQLNKGDCSKFANTSDFKKALSDNDVILSKYDYYGIKDKFGGLTMAIHSWTESNVSVKKLEIDNDGNYTGTLHFVFKDNFGLDKEDVEKYGNYPGFTSWFVLQHYYKNRGKYKPFKTVVEIDYPISGKIEGYNEK